MSKSWEDMNYSEKMKQIQRERVTEKWVRYVDVGDVMEKLHEHEDEIETLKAENERLRAALEDIKEISNIWMITNGTDARSSLAKIDLTAGRVLKGKEDG